MKNQRTNTILVYAYDVLARWNDDSESKPQIITGVSQSLEEVWYEQH